MRPSLRDLALDALTVALLSVYGVQVCPLLDALAPVKVVALLLAAVGLARVGAQLVAHRFGRFKPADERPRFVQRVAFGRAIASGALLALFEQLVWGYPVAASFKLLMGVLTLGAFSALDARFEEELRIIAAVERGDASLERMGAPSSRIGEIFTHGLLTLLLVVLDLYLVVFKDFEELSFVSGGDLERAAQVIGVEFAVVAAVLVAGLLHLMRLAVRNLRRLFEAQTRVLRQISEGQLSAYVPVATDDEFGVIASYTNQMIDALRERKLLRETLGKVVDPAVAERLLAGGLHAEGRRQELVVLFADIRGFTTWTEGAEPETVVRDLNRYFSVMVSIVHRHGGIVDKFMGDGLMAVFGLDAARPLERGPEERAVAAAAAMIAALPALDAEVSRPLRIGVGVHRGEAVVGVIGAPERLEYTCVGDAVNTAARVESMTRSLGAALLITGSVRAALRGEGWRSLGEHPLKGKAVALELFAPL